MSSSIDPAGMRRPGATPIVGTWRALLLLLLLLCCITAPAAAQSLPGAPVIGTASSSPVPPGQSGSATVTFTAPASDGGSPITGYTLTSSPGGITSSTSSSPASINGLTLGTSYTFSVTATNGVGTGSASGVTNAVTPRGQQTLSFTNPGSLNFGTTTPLQAISSSGLPVQLASNTLNTCAIINTSQVQARAPGICSVTASQPGDGAYLPASDVTQSFQIVVPGGALSIATTSLPAPVRGTPYAQTIVATSGAPPYTFAIVSGALPANLTLNSVTGTISGLVTGVSAYNFRVRVTDVASQTAERDYSGVVVVPMLSISPATLPGGKVGVPFPSTSFTTTGGIGAYSYAITAGALPTGLSLSPAGVLAGMPTAAGTANITITATDAYNVTASQPLTVVISDATPVAADDLASVAANGSADVDVTRNDSGVITSVAMVTAPQHGTAVLSGLNILYTPAPNYFGSDSLRYTVTGPGGTSAPATLTLIVSAGPLPIATTRTAALLAGTTLTIKAADGASNGPFTAAAISTPPASGSVAVQGTDLLYTAAQDATGQVSFDYTLSNAFGVSQPARVTLTVNPAPTVTPMAADAAAGRAVQLNLSRGARGGPFTAANLLAVMPATAGTATIRSSADGYVLDFTPVAAFAGAAQITYTLSNAFATSAPGVVTITVAPRSDPSKDAEVRGILSAQADATRRMAMGQINNFQRRLEQLHSGAAGSFSNGITLGAANAQRPRRSNDSTLALQDANRRYLVQADTASPATPQAAGLQPGALPDGWSLWTGGALNFGSARGGGRDSATDFTTSGLSLGADRALSETFALGGGVGYGHERSDVGDKGSRSSVDSYSVALYASYRPTERFYADGLLGYQWLDLDARRHVTESGTAVHGRRDGTQWFASLSSGYRFIGRTLEFTPYARLDVARARLDGFTEQGDAIHALAYQAQTVNLSTATVGALARWAFKRNGTVWMPQLRAEFGRDLQGSDDVRLGYADLPGAPLYRTTLYGTSRSHGLLGAGINLRTDSAWLLRAEYQTRLDSSSGNDQSIVLGVEKAFGY